MKNILNEQKWNKKNTGMQLQNRALQKIGK
jgi:hypothetical protein